MYLIIIVIILVIFLQYIYFKKETLINFHNIELENELSNVDKALPSVTKMDKTEYNAFTHNSNIKKKMPFITGESVDDGIILRSTHEGHRLKRMHNAKNAMVKLDWVKFFFTELKDNENSVWWDEHEPVKKPMEY